MVVLSGMIANLWGQRKTYCILLASSCLLSKLTRHLFLPIGNTLCIYGYPAYPDRVHISVPCSKPMGLGGPAPPPPPQHTFFLRKKKKISATFFVNSNLFIVLTYRFNQQDYAKYVRMEKEGNLKVTLVCTDYKRS